jgi:hypothetical protein
MLSRDLLPSTGTTLLYGAIRQSAGPVGFNLAMAAAFAGARVIVLTDGSTDANEIPGHVLAWRAAFAVAIGVRLRVHALAVRGHSQMLEAVNEVTDGRSVGLVYRDLSRRSAALDRHDDHWLLANVLAKAFDCTVLTTGHTGPRGDAADPSLADTIIRVATRDDPVRQSPHDLRLTWEKPAGRVVDLDGRIVGRSVIYDAVRDLAEVHADAA